MDNQKVHIVKAAALFINDKGQVLLSKDKGSTKWQVLGGKIEKDESHFETLKRELKEELDVIIEINPKIYMESPPFPAANDPGKIVKFFYYFCKLLSEPKFIENVEYIQWFSKKDVENGNFEFSKATKNFLLPQLIKDDLLS